MRRRVLLVPALAALGVGLLTMHGLATNPAAIADTHAPAAHAPEAHAATAEAMTGSSYAATTPHSAAADLAAEATVSPVGHRSPPSGSRSGDHGGMHRALGTCLWTLAAAAGCAAALSARLRRPIGKLSRVATSTLFTLGGDAPAPSLRLSPALLGVSRS